MNKPFFDPHFADLTTNQRNAVRRLYRCLRRHDYTAIQSRLSANVAIADEYTYCAVHDLFNCWLAH